VTAKALGDLDGSWQQQHPGVHSWAFHTCYCVGLQAAAAAVAVMADSLVYLYRKQSTALGVSQVSTHVTSRREHGREKLI
jgi:hypothetical protein